MIKNKFSQGAPNSGEDFFCHQAKSDAKRLQALLSPAKNKKTSLNFTKACVDTKCRQFAITRVIFPLTFLPYPLKFPSTALHFFYSSTYSHYSEVHQLKSS